MTPLTTLGVGMIYGGTLLRVICFRRLAKHFRFELSLQEDHKLITDGPYAIVRHPSYTGALVSVVGIILSHLGPGSLWYQRGLPAGMKWLGFAYAALLASFALPVVQRTRIEDDVLKAHFKDEWQRWAQRTPYRIIPWVY